MFNRAGSGRGWRGDQPVIPQQSAGAAYLFRQRRGVRCGNRGVGHGESEWGRMEMMLVGWERASFRPGDDLHMANSR